MFIDRKATAVLPPLMAAASASNFPIEIHFEESVGTP